MYRLLVLSGNLRVVILFFLLTSKIIAQSLTPAGVYLDKKSIFRPEGLANTYVKCAVQDSLGQIWIGGLEGVTRLNGSSSVNFSKNDGLPGNSTFALFIDKKGVVWWGGEDGPPSYFNGKRFIQVSFRSKELNSSTVVYQFLETNNLIIITNKGVYERINGRFHRKLTNFSNEKFIAISYFNKIYYLATKNAIYSSKDLIHLKKEYDGNDLQVGGSFSLIKGELYYSCQNIKKLKGDQWLTIIHSNLPYPFTNIVLDQRKILLVAKEKIFKIDKNILVPFPNTQSTSVNYKFLLNDRENLLWTNSNESGVLQLTKKSFARTSYKSLKPRFSLTIPAPNRHFLYMSYTNLIDVNYSSNRLTRLLPEGTIKKHDFIYFYRLINGDILLNNGDDVFFNLKKEIGVLERINTEESPYLGPMVQTSKGEVIVAGDKSLHTFSNGKITKLTDLKIDDHLILSLHLDTNENLWIVGNSNLYCRLNGKLQNVSLLINKKNVKFTGLSFYKDYIVAGTLGDGIFIFELNNSKIRLVDIITEKNGLISNTIYNISIDKYGNCIVICNFVGINYITKIYDKVKREFLSLDKSYIKNFNFENVLIIQEPVTGECSLFTDSTKIVFNRTIINDQDKYKPIIKLKDIKLFLKSVDWNKRDFTTSSENIPNSLHLKYNENFISVDFEMAKFLNPESVTFEYRLLGASDHWSGPFMSKSISFNGLVPGDYELQLRAITKSGVVSDTLIYKFSILPPWWLTIWFKFLVVLVILLSFLIFYKLRIRRLSNQNRLLNTLVTERTLELQESVKENQLLLTIITHDLKGPIRGMGRVLNHLNYNWSANPAEINHEIIKSLDTSIKKLESFTSQFLSWLMIKKDEKLEKTQFNLNELLKELVEKQKLLNNSNQNHIEFKQASPVDVCANEQIVLLVLNNIIENALKYTNRGQVTIELIDKEDLVCIRCSDTGIGMNPSQISAIKNKGSRQGKITGDSFNLGWSVLVDLMNKYQIDFEITSELSQGTNVDIYLLKHY